MLYKVLDKNNYKDFLSGLIKNYNVTGPKKINKILHDFVPVKNFEEIDTGYVRTTLPPAKKILFPSKEGLVSYTTNNIKIESLNESEEKILFAINAWDLNGMNFLDKIFTTDFIDDNYVEKRAKLIVIGMDTPPSDTNFASEMGASYVNSGFDLFMTDTGSSYFIRVATPKGMELLSKYAKVSEALSADFKAYNKFTENYLKHLKASADVSNFHENFEVTYSKNDLWDRLSKNCFSCGSCNLVCPTCFCFNVKDDMKIDLKTGIKSREWDSCMIPDYGLVAGGHNFRSTKANRLKQRYRCKLKTFIDKFGTYSCVGCGRCVEACLAKINICEDINAIKEEVSL
jgi:sulfhydrogenase subunit beta (sulfur reductase)